jgi:hypothetical protein
MIAMMCVRFAPLVTSVDIVNPAASAFGQEQILPNGTTIFRPNVDFPQAQAPLAHFTVAAFDNMAWNQHVLGMSVMQRLTPITQMPAMLAYSQTTYWTKLIGTLQACMWHVVLNYMGFGASTWDSAFAVTALREVRNAIVAFYSRGVGEDFVPRGADLGPQLAGLFAAVTGQGAARDLHGMTVWDYVNPPRSAYPRVWTGTILAPAQWDNLIPVFLSDFWIQMFSVALPQSMHPPPVQGRGDSMYALNVAASMTQILGNRYTAYMSRADHPRTAIDQNSLREECEADIWNVRLMHMLNQFTAGGMQFSFSTGVQVPNMPTQEFVRVPAVAGVDPSLGPGALDVRGSRFSWNTNWIPRIDANGFYIYLTSSDVR